MITRWDSVGDHNRCWTKSDSTVRYEKVCYPETPMVVEVQLFGGFGDGIAERPIALRCNEGAYSHFQRVGGNWKCSCLREPREARLFGRGNVAGQLQVDLTERMLGENELETPVICTGIKDGRDDVRFDARYLAFKGAVRRTAQAAASFYFRKPRKVCA